MLEVEGDVDPFFHGERVGFGSSWGVRRVGRFIRELLSLVGVLVPAPPARGSWLKALASATALWEPVVDRADLVHVFGRFMLARTDFIDGGDDLMLWSSFGVEVCICHLSRVLERETFDSLFEHLTDVQVCGRLFLGHPRRPKPVAV